MPYGRVELPIFLSVRIIESFAMRNDVTGYNGTAGTDSWIQFHICDEQGKCCTSQQLYDISTDGSDGYTTKSTQGTRAFGW